jgi:hypothetical protein
MINITDIQKALSNATEEGVRAFLETLRESKDLAASDLQRNVYKNYNEFVIISQEISNILLLNNAQTINNLNIISFLSLT